MATTSEDENYPISADPSKYVTLPVQNEKIWRMYQTTLDRFWTVHDVYLVDDKEHLAKVFDQQQAHYILELLAFMFASHYTTINKELFMHFMNHVEIKEASYYFGSQADSKKTHSMIYSMLLDELAPSETKDKILSEVVAKGPVRAFLRWAIQSTTAETKSFAQRLLVFATLQGIIFPVGFVLIKSIQRQHEAKMPGLAHSNDLIWKDERLNLNFSCLLYEHIEDGLEDEEAQAIVREAVFHAKNIFTNALPASKLRTVDEALINQFIEHSADKVLSKIQVDRLYEKENPFDWAEEADYELAPANNYDMSSFGEAKFDTDIDF